MASTSAARIKASDREAVFAWVDQQNIERQSTGFGRMARPRPTRTETVDLASNDYLGLGRHLAVIDGAIDATRRWGVGATGSRLVTGTTELHQELEEELAARYGAESALVFASGYAANLAAVTSLTSPDHVIISDRHNHASLIDGCRLSRARTRVSDHNEVWSVDGLMRMNRGPTLAVTETIFSVDGDPAPLRQLHETCTEHGAAMLIDDAHGFGVLGQNGAGTFNEMGLNEPPDIVATITLSKALGAQGGVVLGPRRVIRHIAQSARTFLFDTGLAPAAAGAALAGLRVLDAEPGRVERVRWVADRLFSALTAKGLTLNKPGAAVLALPVGSVAEATEWATACQARGVLVGCFRPPSVPDSVSRLRLTAHADLTDQQIDHAVDIIARTAPKHLRIPFGPAH